MSEQQQFQPGDRVKVTMELTVTTPSGFGDLKFAATHGHDEGWFKRDHVDIELIERPTPPLEPGLYPCTFEDSRAAYLLRWDGTTWRWLDSGARVVARAKVIVLGTVTLNEGVEL